MIKTGLKLGLSGLISLYKKALDINEYGLDAANYIVDMLGLKGIAAGKAHIANIPLLGVLSSYNNLKFDLDVEDSEEEPYIPYQFVNITPQQVEYLVGVALGQNATGFIFEIDSPGGEVYPSKIIAEMIKEINVPTVALIRGMACSGGYMIACACDHIIADRTSDIGSIGVILSHCYYKNHRDGLMDDSIYIGEFKNSNNPLKKNTEGEKKMLEELAKDTYEVFVNLIAKNRGMRRSSIEKLADASIYHAIAAKKLKLIDKIGNRCDAMDYLEEKIGERLPLFEYKLRFKENVMAEED